MRVTLFKKRTGERLINEPFVTIHEAKVQSQRARVTLSQESRHNCHRVSSSRLNLICEGLLLGMRAGGHEIPTLELTLTGEP
jgi:hypothetical protein